MGKNDVISSRSKLGALMVKEGCKTARKSKMKVKIKTEKNLLAKVRNLANASADQTDIKYFECIHFEITCVIEAAKKK